MKKVYLCVATFFLVVLMVLVNSSFREENIKVQLSIQKGQKIYAELCIDCHGENGKGEGAFIGTSLNNQQFLSTFSDEEISTIVDNGRSAATMPGFSFLKEIEKIHLLSFIRSWQTKPMHLESPSLIEGNSSNGEKLYLSNCAMCHGETGSGLLTTATAIANPDSLEQITDQQMWITIAYGREDTRMGPSLKGLEGVKQLEKQDISDIVVYIRDELFSIYDPGEKNHHAH